MHRLRVGDDGTDGVRRVLEIGVHRLHHLLPLLAHGGDVDSRYLLCAAEDLALAPPLFLPLGDERKDGGVNAFAFAYHHAVEKVRKRLGIDGAGTSREQDGELLSPVFRAEGYARKVEHIQHPRIQQLELHREPHDVEVLERGRRLEGQEGDAVRFEERRHILRGRVTALAREVVVRVDLGIEDLHPEVAHADLVKVGETKTETRADGVRLFHGVPLTPRIAGGFFRLRKQGKQSIRKIFHQIKRTETPRGQPRMASAAAPMMPASFPRDAATTSMGGLYSAP